jgi:2-polyprenyl-3-methyl-5-hydroxy-6-metoxy-1,4-benzoquinol methylase
MNIREAYVQQGISAFYQANGANYQNPHETAVSEAISLAVLRWKPDLSGVLDLACGSGEATLALLANGAKTVEGIDPYTGYAYLKRTGKLATKLTFEQIAAGKLNSEKYSLIVCSYALHLLEPSRLPLLYYRLAEISSGLLILSPHKRPVINNSWKTIDEFAHKRVRVRYALSDGLS